MRTVKAFGSGLLPIYSIRNCIFSAISGFIVCLHMVFNLSFFTRLCSLLTFVFVFCLLITLLIAVVFSLNLNVSGLQKGLGKNSLPHGKWWKSPRILVE